MVDWLESLCSPFNVQAITPGGMSQNTSFQSACVFQGSEMCPRDHQTGETVQREGGTQCAQKKYLEKGKKRFSSNRRMRRRLSEGGSIFEERKEWNVFNRMFTTACVPCMGVGRKCMLKWIHLGEYAWNPYHFMSISLHLSCLEIPNAHRHIKDYCGLYLTHRI